MEPRTGSSDPMAIFSEGTLLLGRLPLTLPEGPMGVSQGVLLGAEHAEGAGGAVGVADTFTQ